MTSENSLLSPEQRVLPTLERDGSRRWLTPKLAHGRFLTRRRLAAYGLIALFTLIPYTTIAGKPAMWLDLAHRRFTLFGFTFLPTDTLLLALFMVSLILSVFLVTALLGRVWCGWGCPQTVYMEFVFRPIERLCLGRAGVGGKPKSDIGPWRYIIMYVLFLLVSLYLAHTFLAYFVSVARLRLWMTGSPLDHPAAFLVVMVVTAAMMFNFALFREQTCTIACPYGRLQSVLLDRQSLIISYDARRGEPRGKLHKRSLPVLPSAEKSAGDCIDCDMCVSVCPTGIDIRDGLQLECVNCAQCIDACDAVMTKIGKPLGLVGYGSQAAQSGESVRFLRPRVIIYPALIAAIVTLLTVMIITKPKLDVTLLRGLGQPFSLTAAGEVDDTLRVKLTNRTDHVQHVRFAVVDRSNIRVQATTSDIITLVPGTSVTEPVQILTPAQTFSMGMTDITLRVIADDGTIIDRNCRLLGPSAAGAASPH